MGLYVLRRFGQMLLVLVGITLAVFLLVQLVPGNEARAILGPRALPSAVAALGKRLGLDTSLVTRYARFLGRAVRLNLGTSPIQHASVDSLIALRLPVTLWLSAYATVISAALALPLAVLSAVKRNRIADHLVRLITMVTFGMPVFWLGMVLILFFAVRLTIFPPSGYGSGFGGHMLSLTLPALALGLGLAPLVLRTLRGSIIDTLAGEYVEAARARGVGEVAIMFRYVLRNSLIATITVMGVNVGYILSIVVIVENVFALPGLGQLIVTAVETRTFPVVQGVALVLGAIIVMINFLTDVSYSLLDSRVRLRGSQ